ncbi:MULTISPECIES: formylglycine-generating enzyme family protein [unclassified Marinobacter]|jgi:formylglycine-generating enzyme required for sulfatase activity|uniref:formylglycine-generating enzyme family protein n=1 Tax=unclassified Marinobacter TaxID=83889 RepID=UPI00126977DE|nr:MULTISPECIES: SUMF1/EgtB/PvdO family nonheme iron enzyme [unclassified Marinobacter]QFS86221.1 Serine/threonine-protein kinase pkn1 [Marinobacter sp. THAF197a]QFT50002.1 Serine/threonine-protein kinase pkn1 [Marinobacter sp. THAF39]
MLLKLLLRSTIAGSAISLFAFLAGCSSPKAPSEIEIEAVLQRAKSNLVFVEGGEFWLGDVGNESGVLFNPISDDNKPPKLVEIESFSILKTEVTWGEFVTFLQDVGRADNYTVEKGFKRAVRLPIVSNDDPASPNYKDKPARSPNFQEADGYCLWLAEKTGLPYSLPSEAQWEYAARNRGQPIAYATDTGEVELDKYLQRPSQYIDPMQPVSGNALIHSSSDVERRPVGSYPPNPLGLHDMTGSVAEWTKDWFYPGFDHLPTKNPVAKQQSNEHAGKRVVRDLAGFGDHVGGNATVYGRTGRSMNSYYQGFRCVVNQPEPIE